MGDLHADRGGQAVAHRAKAAACHPAVRSLKAQILRGPHLVLANLGGDVAIHAFCQRLQSLERILRLDGLFAVLEVEAVDGLPLLDLRPPLCKAFLVHLAAARLPDAQQVFQHMTHIAQDRHINADHLVDRGGVDIDMCLHRVGAEVLDPAGDAVIKASTDVDHQIAAMHGEVRLIEPVHAQHAQPVPPRRRIGAQTHQGRGDRKARGIHQFAQKLACCGARVDHAAAGIENRPLGLFQKLHQPGDLVNVAFHLGLIMRGLDPFGGGVFAGGELHILGNVDQHRPRTARRRHMEGSVDGLGQALGLFHQPVHLGAGTGDPHGIGFLKAVGADHEGGHLTREHHQRDGVEQRIGQAGHRVGRAGARGHQRHARLAGRAGIAFGHVDRALLVPDEDVANVVLQEEFIIDRKHGAAGVAEDDLHPLILQRLHDHLRTGHGARIRLGHVLFLCAASCRGWLGPMKKPPEFPRGRMGNRMVNRHRPMRVIPTMTRSDDIPPTP